MWRDPEQDPKNEVHEEAFCNHADQGTVGQDLFLMRCCLAKKVWRASSALSAALAVSSKRDARGAAASGAGLDPSNTGKDGFAKCACESAGAAKHRRPPAGATAKRWPKSPFGMRRSSEAGGAAARRLRLAKKCFSASSAAGRAAAANSCWAAAAALA